MPWLHINFVKYNTQELHFLVHNPSWAKWHYTKDPDSTWFYFYNALHKNPPAEEKIVNWYQYWTGNGSDQVWVYMM